MEIRTQEIRLNVEMTIQEARLLEYALSNVDDLGLMAEAHKLGEVIGRVLQDNNIAPIQRIVLTEIPKMPLSNVSIGILH